MPIKPAVKIKEKSKLKKIVLFLVFLVVFLLGLIFTFDLTQKRFETKKSQTKVEPTPTTSREKTFPPSKYATDSAILEIEENLNLIEKDLSKTNPDEASLRPPILDMKVRF